MILTEDEDVVEHLSPERSDEAFSEGIHVRCAYRRAHDAHLLFARVAAGGCPPAAPTDPDVQNSRIRLFGTRIRYAGKEGRRMRARGSGLRSSSCLMRSHVMRARCERRPSHLRQTRTTCSRKCLSASKFPVIP